MEKQNKAERLQLKREEMARIRTLVGGWPAPPLHPSVGVVCLTSHPLADNAYSCDPRVREFRAEERQQKAAQRQAREEAMRQREEEREKVGAQWAPVQTGCLCAPCLTTVGATTGT